jgi:hypothetical protein
MPLQAVNPGSHAAAHTAGEQTELPVHTVLHAVVLLSGWQLWQLLAGFVSPLV